MPGALAQISSDASLTAKSCKLITGTPVDVKSGLQLARKLYIFPSSSKVNPLGSSDEKLRSLSRHLPDASASSEAMPQQQCAQAPWADLPESVVEKVFRILKADQQKSDSKGFPVSSEEAQVDWLLLVRNQTEPCNFPQLYR